MTSDERRALWTARIHDYRASGECATAWCERHQVTRDQLWYWLRKLKLAADQASTGQPKFACLRLEEPNSDAGMPILIRVGAAVVEVRPGFEPAVLANVVRVLQSLC